MTREEALELLHSKMQNQNLRRHCYAVGAVMRTLANNFNEDEAEWEIAGLLHDMDYEVTKDEPKSHTRLAIEWLNETDVSEEVKNSILAHGWGYVEGNPEPSNNMEWSIYCCDELTGLIVACALVKPDKKLSSVTVESIKNKWNQKAFAAGVNRDQIAMCEEKLNITLDKFIGIALTSMQEIHEELGL
jgi:putative nucleotidyltransferase with HDIG domain